MSRRDDRVSLVDMLIHAREAVALSSQKSLKDLESDRVFQLAMQKLVEIVGEAANRVSQETQQGHPGIPWPEIIGTRNRLTHGYDDVNLDILWEIVETDLPPLIQQLEEIVGEEA